MNLPIVSVIIRTHNRNELLARALESVHGQTFKDIQIVVIEDGPSLAEKITEAFADLNIIYYATGEQIGRVKAANIGLSLAKGKYINFLDDDDFFYPNHVQLLVQALEKNPDYDAAHAGAVEIMASYKSLQPLIMVGHRMTLRYMEAVDHDNIFFRNFFPIQAVMFKQQLIQRNGGMDESLELLEDWDLWIKFSLTGQYYFINEVTSAYIVHYDKQERTRRKTELMKYEKIIQDKYKAIINSKGLVRPNVLQRIARKYKRVGFMAMIRDLNS
ncbi:glycosyltransferase [Paenibacillus sp. R14(2021)]|uniref:glycosyltransferase n=1 Tax=Paenibacillus sp. R14(2021) TaxID=2859228 RepID=UPI001C613294|nr:glycosyltransferase [Paenibacillus sp. R14(2021)]